MNIKNVKSYPSMLSTYFYQKTIEIIQNDERNHVNSRKISSKIAIDVLSPDERMPFSVRYVSFQHAKDGLLQVKIGRFYMENDWKYTLEHCNQLIDSILRQSP
jgi:hypothetical protein